MSNRMRPKGQIGRPRSAGYATGRSKVPRDMAKLPAKMAGEHRWAAIAQHSVTDDQARAFAQGSAIALDGSKMFEMVIGCADCEQDYVTAFGTPCKVEGT